jgi:hypothetical protein
MAALPATPGSDIVLTTSGGSPDWLLGPLRFAGTSLFDGPLAGPVFYAGLWVALILYVVVLRGARELPVRVVFGAVAGLHLVFLLAPPLLSHDMFSYIAYARLGAEHSLDPYMHAPVEIPGDPVYPYTGSVGAVSAYGPIFTLLTYPLAWVSVPAALWILKAVAALASLALVGVVWRIARLLDRDPVVPALAVGLHPLVLVHVVGGAHNEALVMLVAMAGVLVWVAGREAAGAALATVAAGLKASAAIVVPFLVASARGNAVRVAAGAVAGAAMVVAVGVIGFGSEAFDAFGLIGDNQHRTSRFSLPHKLAQLLALVLPGDAGDYRDAVRAVLAAAFAAVFVWLLWRTWRGTTSALDATGWATLAVLIASAWLVPWYILWLLPFAALSADRRLWVGTLGLTAWMFAISVPL